MRGVVCTFNGLVRSTVVRRGESRKLLLREGGNFGERIYAEMLIQVCRDYPSLPDPRTLSVKEIKFFYEGVRKELEEHTKG